MNGNWVRSNFRCEAKATRFCPSSKLNCDKNPPITTTAIPFPGILAPITKCRLPKFAFWFPEKSTSKNCIWVPNKTRLPNFAFWHHRKFSIRNFLLRCEILTCSTISAHDLQVVSQSRWCHKQYGVTVKVLLQSMWCHSQGSVTVKVVSQSG